MHTIRPTATTIPKSYILEGGREEGREGRERGKGGKGGKGEKEGREGREGRREGGKGGKEGREREEDFVHFMRHTKTHYILQDISQDTPSSCLMTISHNTIITSTIPMMMPSIPTPMAIGLKEVRLSSTTSRQPCQFLQ